MTTSTPSLALPFGRGLDRRRAGRRRGPQRHAGLFRLFNSQMGTEISWLLPAALVVLSAGLVATARRARLDRTRAALPEIAIWVEAHLKSLSVGGTTVYDLS